MSKFISTLVDPIGLGIGRAITGKDSGIVNVNPGKKKDESGNTPPPAPAAPNPDAIAEEEKKKLQKKLANRTQTIYTSPLGVTDQANTLKQKLGE